MNTPSNKVKAQFFALYFGQKVLRGLDYKSNDASLALDYVHLSEKWMNHYLLLRSVDQLTDTQLVEIAGLRGYRKDHLDVVEGKELKEILGENKRYLGTFDYKEVRLCIVDYLRLNGFITPFTYLSEDNKPIPLSPSDLIGFGWVKMEKEL